jgi:cytochrome b pre-mRNA-processing protein 3
LDDFQSNFEDAPEMLDWLTGKPGVKRKAEKLYGSVVTAARQPGFYGAGRVADTPEGRFDMIALHLFLVAERIKSMAPDGEALAQAMIEAFVTDMDDCMREMGVGDLTVPKRVKRAAAVFYERGGALRQALAGPAFSGDRSGALEAVVLQTILQSGGDRAAGDPVFAGQLSSYIQASHDALTRRNQADVAAGRFEFASPPPR